MPKTYKIIFLGNTAVGKTTIISQYLHTSMEAPTPTIGMDYVLVSREINGSPVNLQVWDTAGQERFHSIISNYTRNTFLAVIVFAVNDAKSVQKVESWINDFVLTHNKETRLMVVGNKVDLEATGDNIRQGEEIAARVGARFVLSSGLSPGGIERLSECINEIVGEELERTGGVEETARVVIKTKPRRHCGC